MDPLERAEAVREAQAQVAAIDGTAPVDAAFVVEGAGLMWSSVATGSTGTPTRFSRTAFGSGVLRVPVLNQHESKQPIGIAEVVPSEDGLHVRAKLSNTSAARDALALVKDGALSGFSVGFGVVKSHREGDVRVVTEAVLDELSLVTFPADRKARIMTAGGQPTPRYLHAASPKERERAVTNRGDVLAAIQEATDFARSVGLDVQGIPTTSLDPNAEPRWFYESLHTFDDRSAVLTREMAKAQMEMYEAAGLTPLAAAIRRGQNRGAS